MSYLPVGIDGGQLGIAKWPSITGPSCACRSQVYIHRELPRRIYVGNQFLLERNYLSHHLTHCSSAKTMVHLKVCVRLLKFRLWGMQVVIFWKPLQTSMVCSKGRDILDSRHRKVSQTGSIICLHQLVCVRVHACVFWVNNIQCGFNILTGISVKLLIII